MNDPTEFSIGFTANNLFSEVRTEIRFCIFAVLIVVMPEMFSWRIAQAPRLLASITSLMSQGLLIDAVTPPRCPTIKCGLGVS
jgi:hypothetical protein